MTKLEWRKVVFAGETDEFGMCPVCKDIDYAECDCPGPSMDDEYEYQVIGNDLFARKLPVE